MYGESEVTETIEDWHAFRPYFVGRLFDDEVANAISPTAAEGGADKMQARIGYSAIDDGAEAARPFGDTGIRALYDDASNIGKVLRASDASATLVSSSDAIARIVVQFAGQLAYGKVLQSASPESLQGILSLNSNETILAIDFSDPLWTLGRSSAQTNVLGRNDLLDKVFKQTNGIFEGTPAAPTLPNDIRSGMKWLWNDDTSSIIDRIEFATKDGPLTATLPARTIPSNKVSLFAAGGGADSITGSTDHEFVFGGNGDDILRGGVGNDLLAGGLGDDRLSGGAGRDFLTGGEGKDTVFYEGTGGTGIEIRLRGLEA